MFLHDIFRGFKIFRESTKSKDSTVIDPIYKANQGYRVTDQNDEDGHYTTQDGGEEEGWGFTPRTEGENTIGSWAQAIPAILKTSDNKIYPLKDKTLVIDTDYTAKEQSQVAEDTPLKVRVAEESAEGQIGVILTCLNHASEEQIFFPLNLGEARILVDNANAEPLNKSTKIYDVLPGGQVSTSNIGHTHDFLYINNNRACLKTESLFYKDANKVGPMNFEDGEMPQLADRLNPKYYEVRCVFHEGKWCWYCLGD